MAAAREAVTVLLPTPPLPLTTAMTRLMLECAFAGTRMSRALQSAPQLEQSWVQFSDMISGISFNRPDLSGPGPYFLIPWPRRADTALVYRTRVFSVKTSSRVSWAVK